MDYRNIPGSHGYTITEFDYGGEYMTTYIVWNVAESEEVKKFYKFVTEGKEELNGRPYPNNKKMIAGSDRLSPKQINILKSSGYNIEVYGEKPRFDFVDKPSQLPYADEMEEFQLRVLSGTLLKKAGVYEARGGKWVYISDL